MTNTESKSRASWLVGPIVSSAMAASIALACGGADEGTTGANGGGGGEGDGTGAGGEVGTGGVGTGGDGMGGLPDGSGNMTGSGAVPAGGTGGIGAGGVGMGGIGVGGALGGAGGGITPSPTGCRAPVPASAPGNVCPGTPPPNMVLTPVVTGIDTPVFVTQAPGDATRLFVIEQRGRIVIVSNGAVEAAPFLDIQALVRYPGPVGEQGLLGLAFDPRYAETGRFWVNYSSSTSGQGDTVVAEYHANPGQPADPSSASIVTTIPQVSFVGNHKGGMLAFGPDGCLFVGMGDGGDGNDPNDNGQNVTNALGSMLRIDVDRFPEPAPGNATLPGADPHTWSYGFRNPWRFSFDRVTGDLYIGDVGQDAWEEVDVEPVGVAGRNYGWRVMEGLVCRGGGPCDTSGKTLPVAVQSTDVHSAVIGGYVYRGSAIPSLQGRYLYGGYGSHDVFSFVFSGEQNGQPEICDAYDVPALSPPGDISSFGQDNAGELYIVTIQGTVYRIDPA